MRTDRTRPRTRPTAWLLAAAVLVALLPACAGSGQAEPTTVAILLSTRQPNVSRELADGFVAGASQVPGIKPVVEGPGVTDGPASVEMFDGLMRTSPAGIAVWSLTPNLFFEPLREAARAEIPMIAVDNPPSDPDAVPLFVGNDNVELGRQLARVVVDQMDPLPTAGSVVLGTQLPGVPVLDQRITGIREEFGRLLPGVQVLGPFDTRQEEATNQAAWQVLVDGHPEAVAFVGTGDSDSVSLGTIRAEEHGSWIGAGCDLDPRSLAAVERGDLVLVSPEHFLKAAVAGRLLAAQAAGQGGLPRGWIVTPTLPVDRDNIAQVLERQRSAASRTDATRATVDAILADLPAHTRPLEAAG